MGRLFMKEPVRMLKDRERQALLLTSVASGDLTAFSPSPFSRPQCSFMGMLISHDMLLGRWRLSLELFGRVFMEDVGAEPGSVCILCT